MIDDRALAVELQALEERLLDPACRRDPARVRALLAPDFVEFGSSGRVFDREAVVEALTAEDTPVARRLREPRLQRLADDVALLTYRVERDDGRLSLRSSVWRCDGAHWQLLFHQGTAMPQESAG